MKLTVRTAEIFHGERTVLLCDETGNPLPNQRRTVLDCQAAKTNEITVTFVIDDELVSIDQSPAKIAGIK